MAAGLGFYGFQTRGGAIRGAPGWAQHGAVHGAAAQDHPRGSQARIFRPDAARLDLLTFVATFVVVFGWSREAVVF